MKKIRLALVACSAIMLAAAAFCSDPLPADSMNALRTMLDFAQGPKQDNLTLDMVQIEPNFSMPEVFFGMARIDGDWPIARRKAVFDAYLAGMGDIDFTDVTNKDRGLALKATAQCMTMNYTNALPHMRRLVLNTTLTGWMRRREIGRLIALSPVCDETTATIEVIFTNRVAFSWEDREECFDYALKMAGASQSNLVSQTVSARAAHVFTCDATEWQLYGEYDRFWKKYYTGYAMSSNRLELAMMALANTNIMQSSNWAFLKRRFTSVTNQLLSSGQPLVQLDIGEGE